MGNNEYLTLIVLGTIPGQFHEAFVGTNFTSFGTIIYVLRTSLIVKCHRIYVKDPGKNIHIIVQMLATNT